MARSPKTAMTDNTATTSIQTDAEVPQAQTAKRSPRAGSKLAQVVALLESAEGATIAEMMAATGWQQHTVRGALAGSITKKLGRAPSSDKFEGRGRVYRL